MDLLGRLAAQPELSTTTAGAPIVKYAVGTSYGSMNARKTSWWKVVYYPKENGEDHQKNYILSLGKG